MWYSFLTLVLLPLVVNVLSSVIADWLHSMSEVKSDTKDK